MLELRDHQGDLGLAEREVFSQFLLGGAAIPCLERADESGEIMAGV